MSLEAILAAIPHREPFLLLDEIVEQGDRKIVCRKSFSGDEWWYRGHYPSVPLTPGVLLCEAAMQAGAVLLAHSLPPTEGKVPVATRADKVQFKKMVLPGDSILVEAEWNDEMSGVYFLTGRVRKEDVVAARLNFCCMLVDADRVLGH